MADRPAARCRAGCAEGIREKAAPRATIHPPKITATGITPDLIGPPESGLRESGTIGGCSSSSFAATPVPRRFRSSPK
ncbi:hypothetical protein GCM10010172_37890 [Paractinoplanes ferrugineus]|uniref:Uncharacterized protein n=1 Tax=Paractinoplanes ferrugineus TaxID=113564 RepID=A0A919IUP6_9ACTN|nr:hypothetical protein Afe05nite_12260 [Actinoplanes ferrugineus]